jgi:F0F1-type ATP synthase membrane subunit b/b'
MMGLIALIIAIIALILAYKAYTRSGGNIEEMRANINELGLSTEKIRKMTADALSKMEKTLRGGETSSTETKAPAEDSDDETPKQ